MTQSGDYLAERLIWHINLKITEGKTMRIDEPCEDTGHRVTQVTDQLQRLRDSLCSVDELQENLGMRMQSVLRREPEPCDECVGSVDESLAPLAEEIRDINIRVDQIAGRFRDVLGRLEV